MSYYARNPDDLTEVEERELQGPLTKQQRQATAAALTEIIRSRDMIETDSEQLARLRQAIDDYTSYQPLDLKSPHEIQRELRAILGAPHIHQRRIKSDLCQLCGLDLRHPVHLRTTGAA